MILNLLKYLLVSIIIIYPGLSSFAQEVSVSITPQKLSIGNNLKITLSIENSQIKNYGQFPEIPGFRKSGISSSSSTNFVNGKMSSSQSITQNYTAVEIGIFEIPRFSIQINEQTININPKIRCHLYLFNYRDCFYTVFYKIINLILRSSIK